MRFASTLPLLATLALPLTGCFDRHDKEGCHGPAPSSVTDLTRGEWFRIGSASTGSTEVFRPQGEPQRGSHFKYMFAADGNYSSWAVDCTSHDSATGTWTLKDKALTLYPTGGAAQVKQVVSISGTELQLAR